MKTLTFVGRPIGNDILEFTDDNGEQRSVKGGEEFRCGDNIALELMTNPHISIAEVQEALETLSRAKLEDIARDRGIDNPDDKSVYPTKADLVEALDNPPPVEHDHPLPDIVEDTTDGQVP